MPHGVNKRQRAKGERAAPSAPRRSLRPPWFQAVSLDRPSWWARIQIAPDRAAEWVADVIDLWKDPTMVRFGDRFRGELAQWEARLKTMDWSQVTDWELVGMVHTCVSVQFGIEKFLPPPLRRLPLNVRQWLYFEAVYLITRDKRLTQNPDTPAAAQTEALLTKFLAALSQVAAPYIEAEIARRAKQHVGSHAGLLLFIMGAAQRMKKGLPHDLDQASEEALKRLRMATWRKADSTLKGLTKDLKRGLPGGKQTSVPHKGRHLDALQELGGEIVLTLQKRYGDLNPMEDMARALSGEWNIAPAAIHGALVDRLRWGTRRQRTEILVVS